MDHFARFAAELDRAAPRRATILCGQLAHQLSVTARDPELGLETCRALNEVQYLVTAELLGWLRDETSTFGKDLATMVVERAVRGHAAEEVDHAARKVFTHADLT